MKKIYLFALAMSFGLTLSAQYEIGHTTITFNDPDREGGFGSGGGSGRQIQTEIYYPANQAGDDVAVVSGEYPVIVFGHGFVMTWEAYRNIWEYFAPKGYILAFPRTEGGFSPVHEDFGKDLSIVLDEMLALSNESNSIFHNVLNGKSAIMGHSMGGGSTMLAASQNTNVTTIVGFAPAETTPSAIDAANSISVPALILSGEKDGVTPDDEHHIPIYDALSSSCKYFVSILGGAHCYFANTNFNCDLGEGVSSTGISISRDEQHIATFDVVLPWFSFYLNGDNSAINAFHTSATSDSRYATDYDCETLNISAYELNEDNLRVYPNPVSNFLNLELSLEGEYAIRLIDLQGRKVIEEKGYGDFFKVNVEGLHPGIYQLVIESDGKQLSKKVVVE